MSTWNDDHIQFARLLAEIQSCCPLTVDQYQELQESMDLGEGDINELFDRAELAWERYKTSTQSIQFWNDDEYQWQNLTVSDLTIVHETNRVATAIVDGMKVFIQGGIEDVNGKETWEAFDAEMSGLSEEELKEIGFSE